VRRRRHDRLEQALEIVYFVTLNALAHLAFVGSRMATTLFALHLGASEFTTGLLMALFALLPMFLSVASGRLIDRVGPGRPIAISLGALAVATSLPFFFPHVATLYVSSTLLGVSFLFTHIGMNSVFGAYGTPEQRALNFSWLALGFSISATLGPLTAGFAIDWLGHAGAFLLLSACPAVALVLLALRKQPLPRPERGPREAPSGVFSLWRIAPLRATFIVSGLLAMGWDLYSFLLPLYGARLGLAAATIGVIMATFSIATFAIRLAMPIFMHRMPHWIVISGALALSGVSYLLFPFVASVPLLMAISFLLGLGLGCAQPVIMAVLFDASPAGRQGEAIGVRTLTLNASHTVIPLASGAISAAVGMGPAFWAIAALLLAGAWYARGKN
jgi:MFS family permease